MVQDRLEYAGCSPLGLFHGGILLQLIEVQWLRDWESVCVSRSLNILIRLGGACGACRVAILGLVSTGRAFSLNA
jgi:hypothetical protein